MSKFEWDEAKNNSNIKKHGISFKTASHIFDGDIFTFDDDRKDYKELRKISIGKIFDIVIIVVAHTKRNGKIRIISARPAKSKEREAYHEYIRQRTQH